MFSDRKNLLLLISSVFLFKLFILLFFIHELKTWEDTEIAEVLLKTGEFKCTHNGIENYNFPFPVFAFFQFLVFWLFGHDYLYVVICQLIISSLTAFLLYYVLRKFLLLIELPQNIRNSFNTIAWTSVLLFILHPVISYYCLKNLHPFTTDLFFSILMLFILFYVLSKSNMLRLILLGIVLGIAGLIHI